MKSADRLRPAAAQVGVGIIVAAAGILFLLDNLDIISIGNPISFWPTVLIVFGLVKLADSRTPGGRVVGTVLLGTGTVLILHRTGVLDVGWRVLWPTILIVAGGAVVYQAMMQRSGATSATKDAVPGPGAADDHKVRENGADSEDTINVTAILGAFQRRLTSPRFAGGDITALMGDCSIDLRACSIQGEAVINVFAVMGGITLKCPADWTVILHGTPIMGGFEEKTMRPPDGSKRLVVKGYAIMGGVDVHN